MDNPLNPYIFPIEGDLSRADFVVLCQLCRGKDVVEYGCGGSTILLSQIAKSLVCFDTKEVWIERTRVRLAELPNKQCEPEIHLIDELHNGSSVKGLSRPCDVLFDDGWAAMRWHFLLEFWEDIRECAIHHDTRATYASNVVIKFFSSYISTEKPKYAWGYPYAASLKTIEWSYLESNMCVMFKRNCALLWEDWKQTEADSNRVGYGVSR